MREIKFRAWDKKKNKIIDYSWRMSISMAGEISWSINEYNGNLQEIGQIVEDASDRFVLEQFTGLHDKNGKEIYEGDIVRIDKDTMAVDFCGQPEIDEVVIGFRTWLKNEKFGNEGECLVNPSFTEIIGNVHDQEQE